MNLKSIPNLPESGTVLMFSGGRDSTLAAVRLNRTGMPLTLVTISSMHITGIERVHMRLAELANHLPGSTPWLHIEQPIELRTDISFYDQTCLPCHHAYVLVAVAVAKKLNFVKMAFGYAQYQNDWPEQTPLAVSRLTKTLQRYGIELILPVYDIASREHVVAELQSYALCTESLEQKCLRQVTNVALSEERLVQQVELWEKAIERSMAVLPSILIKVISHKQIGDFLK